MPAGEYFKRTERLRRLSSLQTVFRADISNIHAQVRHEQEIIARAKLRVGCQIEILRPTLNELSLIRKSKHVHQTCLESGFKSSASQPQFLDMPEHCTDKVLSFIVHAPHASNNGRDWCMLVAKENKPSNRNRTILSRPLEKIESSSELTPLPQLPSTPQAIAAVLMGVCKKWCQELRNHKVWSSITFSDSSRGKVSDELVHHITGE
jgi:hypothetical protein